MALPGESNFIAKIINKNNGEVITKQITLKIKSKIKFDYYKRW